MKNLYEVFDEFEKAPNRQAKINVLRNNKTYAMECVLRGAFHPDIKYVFDEIPTYNDSLSPPGLGYTNIHQELDRVYLYEQNNPRTAPNLSLDRKKYLLIQVLESMEKRESEIFGGMIVKRLPVKGLTYKLVAEAFPDLLPNDNI
jgi:hypothetical protein